MHCLCDLWRTDLIGHSFKRDQNDFLKKKLILSKEDNFVMETFKN